MLSIKTCVHSFMVKNKLIALTLLCFIHFFAIAQMKARADFQGYNMPSYISIRALQAVNDSTVWFAANHGVYGYTEDAGANWFIDSIKAGSVYPEFRSIAVLDQNTVLLLSIDSPAYLFKTTTKGKKWKQVYTNNTSGIFFDSMKFSDDKNGIAVGDPINNCFKIITTNDGGETWTETPCENIPTALKGEACFAASNSNISAIKNKIWFATGGTHARVFYSDDFGKHFTANSTPMAQGEKMTGIYSVYFTDENTGIIGGGNYEKTEPEITTLCLTHDGGKTWQPVKTTEPFFASSVFIHKTNDTEVLFCTGHNGTYQVDMRRNNTIEMMAETFKLMYNTMSFPSTGSFYWMAGNKGRIGRFK